MSTIQALPTIPGEPAHRQEEDDEFLSNRARRFLLGSTLVRDACTARFQIDFKRDLISVKLYEKFYTKWAVGLYYFFTIVNLSTIIVEYPPTLREFKFVVPYYVPLVVNLICEAYFYRRWFMLNAITEKKGHWDNLSLKMSIVILLLMTLDAFIMIITENIKYATPVRWSRFMRPILLLTFPENRRLRSAFSNLARTIVDITPVFTLTLTTIGLVSIIGATTLAGQDLTYPSGRRYFNGFLDVFWDMYILTTKANSPDVIIPAYEHNRVYILMYVFVCVICRWLLLGALTASIYNSYKMHLGKSMIRTVAKRKVRLDEAFGLVATSTPSGDTGISLGTFMRLMRIAKPGRTEDALRVIFHILNRSRSGYLNATEFGRLAEYVRAHLTEIELSHSYFEAYLPKYYNIYSSAPFQVFRRIIQNSITKMFFISLIIINIITSVILRRYASLQNSAEWFFTMFFFVETLSRYLAAGGVRFFEDNWNRFDFIVVVLAFIAQILQSGLDGMGIVIPGGITQMILVLRVGRLLRFLSIYKGFRALINCIIIILPSLGVYAFMMFIFFYIFSCLGMEVFQYLYESPPNHNYTIEPDCYSTRLHGSEFARLHYCIFGFNSITESMVMLLALVVGNNWHVLTEGISLTSSGWARVFFMLVHWICVLLVLNIVLAFIIEAFLIEYTVRNTQFESYIHQRLEEMGMDGKIELEKRGIQGFGKRGFHLTQKELDQAFPPNSPITKAFFLRIDKESLEVIMYRMFQKEIEQLILTYETEQAAIRINGPHGN